MSEKNNQSARGKKEKHRAIINMAGWPNMRFLPTKLEGPNK